LGGKMSKKFKSQFLKLFLIMIIFMQFTLILTSKQVPTWKRYPAISPNGKTIVCSFQGDLFTVSSNGGKAIQLT